MSWGKDTTKAPPSTIRQLLPLLVTLLVLAALAWIGYQIYLSLGKIQMQARKQMGDNVTFTKDGVRLKVQGMEDESYVDRTQSWVVKAWELGTGTGSGAGSAGKEGDAKRKRFITPPFLFPFRREIG
ncbi:uncharacterized protein C8A04DRAFT_32389 [Dichotomopilus funicola]|uniref:Uncharacterized protein n=1 Tax=Dichotomopilus funicola TaxID=1934379 RepID=A0AAN6UVQ3_9PEZI|nr:hypothetical protein C8A04DRAFT_32389 [Dichotomopilus funicola]